ncbi:DUF1707 SHOCT-like domain-containing protein [Nakamurella deserti]|uniref:DUF1707 SHOCT-like domain-containing protein n=1 Tax=Nakamurella deserti TaxID=2164074 RepID=UPI000DBE7BD7|nr:DUF1707 domain-containing protein [Nakamurella deserti]
MTVPPGGPDPTDRPRPSVRIGDAERNAAADALQQHLTAGRLTLDEYADRSALVMNARTQDEVDEVFGDLPPVVGAPGAAGTPAIRSATGSALAGAAGVPPATRAGGGPSRALLRGLMGGMPIIALLLFLATRQWWFFLLIPLSYAVLGPMLNNSDDGKGGPELERGPGR